jgi:hypothetical protein
MLRAIERADPRAFVSAAERLRASKVGRRALGRATWQRWASFEQTLESHGIRPWHLEERESFFDFADFLALSGYADAAQRVAGSLRDFCTSRRVEPLAARTIWPGLPRPGCWMTPRCGLSNALMWFFIGTVDRTRSQP